MSTLSQSYENFINTGAGSNRPGGDNINISFTKGKKSNKQLLEELAIAKATRDLELLGQTSTAEEAAREKQRYGWEAADQQMQTEQAQLTKEEAARDAAAATRSATAENFAMAERVKNAPLEYKSKAATLKAQEYDNFVKQEAYNRVKAAEARDKQLRAQSLAYDMAAGNPDTGKPWATTTPEQARRGVSILESYEMPQYAAHSASRAMSQGLDPASAYSRSFYGGNSYNMSQSDIQQAQNNVYRSNLSNALGGYPNMQNAFARTIYNSASGAIGANKVQPGQKWSSTLKRWSNTAGNW